MTARPRVLIVDDDFAVAGLHRGFVEAHGRLEVVGLAHTGADALRLIDQHKPDLVLLDIYLPDITGIEVLTELRRRSRPVDVIAITAARELDTVRSAMAGGVLHYLVKPFTARMLHERLDDYLRHREEMLRSENRDADLDQQQVDRLLAAPRTIRATAALPKGLSRHTMHLVTEILANADSSLSAQEVGEQVGVSRVSARRYLEHLVATEQATVEPRYGSAGRPENRYTWRS